VKVLCCSVSVSVCLCMSTPLCIVSVRRAAAAHCISLGGEGNVLYPVLSSYSIVSAVLSDNTYIYVE